MLQNVQSVPTNFDFRHNRENLAGFLPSHETIDSFTGTCAKSVKQNQQANSKGVIRADLLFQSYFPDDDTDYIFFFS